ncbi:hypothetical protein JCM17823_04120 [Halorubrum gandharaense]
MTTNSVWTIRTTDGTLYVGPSELCIRRTVGGWVAGVRSALRGGESPFDWTTTLSGVGMFLLLVFGMVLSGLPFGSLLAGTLIVAVGVVSLFQSLGVRFGRDRTVTVPATEIDHVEFHDGRLTVSGTDGNSWDVTPATDAERADAAVALRLRGFELRGAEEDDAVSRTVIDAPPTELVR